MLGTALALVAFGLVGSQAPLHCAASLDPIVGTKAIQVEYAGAMFGLCNKACVASFKASPAALIEKAAKAGKTVGSFEFDPVSGVRINPKKSKANSDFKAIRYFFADAAEKPLFDADPTKYVSDVKSEAYFCPLMKFPLEHEDAGGYVDYQGVRYYLCCDRCARIVRSDPAKYAKSASAAVKPLAVTPVKP